MSYTIYPIQNTKTVAKMKKLKVPIRSSHHLNTQSHLSFEQGVCATGHPVSAEAGAWAIQQGGTAVDALVAAAVTSFVVEPASCGLGGYGHFSVYLAKENRYIGFDAYCRAPLSASPNMFELDMSHPATYYGHPRTLGNKAEHGPLAPAVPGVEHAVVAAGIQYRWQRDVARRRALSVPADLLDWSSTGSLLSHYCYVVAGKTFDLNVRAGGDDYRVKCENAEITVRVVNDSESKARIEVDGNTVDVVYKSQSWTRTYLFMDSESWCFDNQIVAAELSKNQGSDGRVLAPMHGRVTEIMVKAGDVVRKGQRLASLEAMKMEHEIDAPVDGTVKRVACTLQIQVAIDDVLFEII